MSTTALGVAQDPKTGEGTDPLTLRRVISSRWENAGIVTGLEVTGRTDLYYAVSAGCAVTTRGESDGFCEAWWEGGTAGPVSAGDPAHPRVDVVWVKANDLQQGDGDNHVVVGVTQGTPGPSPVAPEAPAGCTVLSRHVMPAGATSTASAALDSERAYAVPHGASLGLLGESVLTDAGEAPWDKSVVYDTQSVQVTIPTDRLLELSYSMTAVKSEGEDHASMWQGFKVDGALVEGFGGEMVFTSSPTTAEQRAIVEVPAGTHVVTVSCCVREGRMLFVYGPNGDPPLPYGGRQLRVWDRGVA